MIEPISGFVTWINHHDPAVVGAVSFCLGLLIQGGYGVIRAAVARWRQNKRKEVCSVPRGSRAAFLALISPKKKLGGLGEK